MIFYHYLYFNVTGSGEKIVPALLTINAQSLPSSILTCSMKFAGPSNLLDSSLILLSDPCDKSVDFQTVFRNQTVVDN